MAKKDPVNILKAALTEKLHIDFRTNPIDIRKAGDAIVLDGMVEGIAAKKTALLLAMGIAGVSGVVDRLKVRPSKSMTDPEILEHFRRAVAEEPTLEPGAVKAEVTDGVLDIEGVVGSLTHKRLAGVLAWWIPGVADVINSLEVVPPEEDTDNEVTDAVLTVIEKDRLVDGSSISVKTSNWVVTLEGAAKSAEQAAAAEADAWYVWGVNEVVNRLKTP